MMPHTAQALGQAQLAELHHHAERGALAFAARQARRARRQQPGYCAPAVPVAVTAWAGWPRPAPEGP